MEYVSHSSVQMLLNDVWTGALKQTDLTARELLFGIFCPPYLYSFDFRTESELERMVITSQDYVDGDETDGPIEVEAEEKETTLTEYVLVISFYKHKSVQTSSEINY